MKYVNIMGRMEDIDAVVERYIMHLDIQLENAAKEIGANHHINSLIESNPYSEVWEKAKHYLDLGAAPQIELQNMTPQRAVEIVEEASKQQDETGHYLNMLTEKKDALEAYMKTLAPFRSLTMRMEDLRSFEWTHFRFGRMPISNYMQMATFLGDDADILYLESSHDRNYKWGVYFVPEKLRDLVDSIFSSLHFEQMRIDTIHDGEEMSGTFDEVYRHLEFKMDDLLARMDKITQDAKQELENEKVELYTACRLVERLYRAHDMKKYAVRTDKDYFVFVGWMTERDAKEMEKATDLDDCVMFMHEGNADQGDSRPPTKLRNAPVVSFFEFFVKMYGLPSYNEIDPTPFIAITYTLLFGIMFGDVGQGALLSILGVYLYRAKKMPIGRILSVIGISSVVFGFLFGSVFGFEHIIHPILAHPAAPENLMNTLVIAVGIGVILVLISMLFHICNAIKQKKWGELLFSPNGIAGIVFYSSAAGIAWSVYTGGNQPATGVFVLLIVLPLALVMFREQLSAWVHKTKLHTDSGPVMFLLECAIEMFEVLLSYFTNTLSFVRVGAFALSHAGMMSVILLLAEGPDGHMNILILIVGNLLVIALEGLVVGIQALRLAFYEMFSRFFDGNGREFRSIQMHANQ